MTAPDSLSTGTRGLIFLGCLGVSPLLGWAVAATFGVRGGQAAATIVTLPAVLLLGYGIWHARRIMRTIRLRLGGTRSVHDDPVAERAEEAFRLAGRLIGTVVFLAMVLLRSVGLALVIGVAAMIWGGVLGRLARDGRLPAPEFE